MFRRFFHIFGKHHWSVWSIPTPLRSSGGIKSALVGYEEQAVQYRQCLICHLYEENFLQRWPNETDIQQTLNVWMPEYAEER